MEDVLTVFKASQYCNVSPKTIINWVESGHIKAYKTVGGHRRINKADLEAFMNKQGIPIPNGETVEGKLKILVVDDDPIIVETIVQALEEDEFDYEVISASDGFEAGLQVNHFAPQRAMRSARKSRKIRIPKTPRLLFCPPIWMKTSLKK
jgi:excisionase family DNA binding protein